MELGVAIGGQARKLDEGDRQSKFGVGKSPPKFMHTVIVGSNPFCAKPTNRKERRKPSCIQINSIHRFSRQILKISVCFEGIEVAQKYKYIPYRHIRV